MRVFSRLLLACLCPYLCMGGLPAMAQTLANLHQVREPVSSQQPQERDAALARALDVLIVRLSGDEAAPGNPGLAALRSNPQQVIRTYGYESGEPQALAVEFEPAAVDRALRQAGIPLWGSNRPSLMLWWLEDGTAGSNLVGDGQPAANILRRAGSYRGLPLQLPLADLQEQLLLTPEVLEGLQTQPLQAASERYSPDALLLVHAREEDSRWQARWRLQLGANQEQGSASATDPAQLADAVLLAVAGRLAPHFLARSGASEELTLIIEGSNLARYAELQQVLAGFEARLQGVEDARLTYRVRANPDQLRSQLGLLHLQEVPVDTVAVEAPVDASGQTEADGMDAADRQPVQPSGTVLRLRW
jgi:hypothetical protein